MTKKYEHGFYGSTAITRAVQQSIDALILGDPQRVFTFTIASQDQDSDVAHAVISFGFDGSCEMLRWRICRGGGSIVGPGSESIFVREDTMDALDYQRAGLAVASELAAHLWDEVANH